MSGSPQLASRVRGVPERPGTRYRLMQVCDKSAPSRALLAADDGAQVASGVCADGRLVRGVESVGGKHDDPQGYAQQDVGDVGQVGIGDVGSATPQRVRDPAGELANRE